MNYPISDNLKEAIEALFEHPSVAMGYLGVDKVFPDDWYIDPPSPDQPYQDRVAMLAKEIEGYISNMAAESEEYESLEDTQRLEAQAVGLLLALRDLHSHFPEAF